MTFTNTAFNIGLPFGHFEEQFTRNELNWPFGCHVWSFFNVKGNTDFLYLFGKKSEKNLKHR